jgi:hypothetical protein
MPETENRDDGIIVSLKRDEAAALVEVAEIGLDDEEAHARIHSTVTTERALRQLRGSRGSVALFRPEAAALATVVESGLALTASPRGRFAPLFEDVDLAAARLGLDQLKGAMR